MQQPSNLAACVPGTGHDRYPFCNRSLPIEARVADLVRRIPRGAKPWLLTARARAALPQLGVPAFYYGHNCMWSSGIKACSSEGRCSTSFPAGPNAAAAFDRQLWRQVAATMGRELRAWYNSGGGGLACWGPTLEPTRDPRWGRIAESGSEDPYLLGEVGGAIAHGMQWGDSRGDGEQEHRYPLLAVYTAKHMAANSLEGEWGGRPAPIGGKPGGPLNRHTLDVQLSPQQLSDFYWPPWRATIRAGARGVMCSYNAINGVPTCLDPLQRAARDAWGFRGYVTSDTDSLQTAWALQKAAADGQEAAARGVRDGGCDVNSGDTYKDHLLAAVGSGRLKMADVDAALRNAFRIRFELGLFDGGPDAVDASPLWRIGPDDIGTDAAQQLNLRAAEESLVLLRNPPLRSGGGFGGGVGGGRHILPLMAGSRLAVLGPHASSAGGLSLFVAHGDESMQPAWAAIAKYNSGRGATVERGCNATRCDRLQQAVALARRADAVVLMLGGVTCRCTGAECEADKGEHGGGGAAGRGGRGGAAPPTEPEECKMASTLDRQCFSAVPQMQAQCGRGEAVRRLGDAAADRATSHGGRRGSPSPSSSSSSSAGGGHVCRLLPKLENKCRATFFPPKLPRGVPLAAATPSAHVEGERHDRRSIDLPQAQRALAAAVLRLGKPVVIVLTGHGGSVALEQELSAPNAAIIDAFQPGGRGAEAIGRAIFGVSNRWGKMPYSMLRAAWVDTNPMYEHDVAGSGRTYRYHRPAAGAATTSSDVLVPFGFGLSLSRWQLALVSVDAPQAKGRHEPVENKVAARASKGSPALPPLVQLRTDGTTPPATISLHLKNLGPFAGDQVVQCYSMPQRLAAEDDARIGARPVRCQGSQSWPRPEHCTSAAHDTSHPATNPSVMRVSGPATPHAPHSFLDAQVKTLIDFSRERDVPEGEARLVTFDVDAAKLQLVSVAGELVATRGEYLLRFELGDGGPAAEVAVQLTGPSRVLESFPGASARQSI